MSSAHGHGRPKTRGESIFQSAQDAEAERASLEADETSTKNLMYKVLSMLDRNLCVTEDSCLFFDSADAIARIIVRARRNPFLPQPSQNAFNNKFIDTVRMHANLPDLKLPRGMLTYETDNANMGFGGRDGDPLASKVDDMRTYADQNVSEVHLLETIRRTSNAARTGRSTDANGADANRFRAAFETAKTMLQKSIGKKHPFYLSMFPSDDPLDVSERRSKRDAVPTEDLVEAALPHLDLSGNARYVPPFYQSLMESKIGRERFKVRPWGRHIWSAAVRQRWYEPDKSKESYDAARTLLTQLVEKNERERRGHVRGDVSDGDVNLMDLALLGGLNPRTFFDVALWHFPNRYHGYDMEEGDKNLMIKEILYFFTCFLTDDVYDGVVEQKHRPVLAIKKLKDFWKSSGDARHREKRLFRNFWNIANSICKRIDPVNPKTMVAPELPVDRAAQVHHFLYNHFTAIDPSEGFAPDITVPRPMHTRAPAYDSMPTFGAGAKGATDDDDSESEWDGEEECNGDDKYIVANNKHTAAKVAYTAIFDAVNEAEKHKKRIEDAKGNASLQIKEIATRRKQLEVADANLGKAKRDLDIALKLCAKTALDEDDEEYDSASEEPESEEDEEARLRDAQRLAGIMNQKKDATNRSHGVKDSKSSEGGGKDQKPPPGIDALWIHMLRCIYRGGRAYVAIVHRLTETERKEARSEDDPDIRRFRELFARLVANVLVQSREAHPTSNRVFWERQMAETQFQRVEIMQQITMLCGVPTPVQIEDPWMKSHPVYF
jgi:hypothetical protein